MLTNCLAACTHLSSTVSQLFEPQVQKIAVFTYRSPHFCFPGDAPATITQYVAWMERHFNACQTPRSIYLSIFNSFRVIRCLNQCVSPHFGFLWRRPWGNHAKCCMDGKRIASMERQFNACQTFCSMYLSTFNSFRVIRCLNQCVSPKIAIFTTFLFPLGTPLAQSR